MNNYHWPANIAQDKDVWVTTLVDWPNVVGTGANPQLSVFSAMTALSAAVHQEIAAHHDIPVPSEFRPGQVQVPLTDEASIALGAYLDERNEKLVNRQFEIERANREKHSMYLSALRFNLDMVEARIGQATDGSNEFASVAIRSAYLLNGGALVAIPAILHFAEQGTIAGQFVVGSTLSFVIGIFLAALTNYLAYLSVQTAMLSHLDEANARIVETQETFFPSEDPSANQTKVTQARSESEKKLNRARLWAHFGVGSFGLSVAAFLIGVGLIIWNYAPNSAEPTLASPPSLMQQQGSN